MKSRPLRAAFFDGFGRNLSEVGRVFLVDTICSNLYTPNTQSMEKRHGGENCNILVYRNFCELKNNL